MDWRQHGLEKTSQEDLVRRCDASNNTTDNFQEDNVFGKRIKRQTDTVSTPTPYQFHNTYHQKRKRRKFAHSRPSAFSTPNRSNESRLHISPTTNTLQPDGNEETLKEQHDATKKSCLSVKSLQPILHPVTSNTRHETSDQTSEPYNDHNYPSENLEDLPDLPDDDEDEEAINFNVQSEPDTVQLISYERNDDNPYIPDADEDEEDINFDVQSQPDTVQLINNESNDDNQIETLKDANKALRTVLTWGRMLSFLCVSGKVRFTSKQYEFLAAAIKTATSGQEKLCTYKTIRSGSQWSFMKSKLFPKSSIYYIEHNKTKKHRRTSTSYQLGVKEVSENNDSSLSFSRDSRDCVRIVLPSEWAKLDLITLPVYDYLYGDYKERSTSLNIEDSPFIQDKNKSTFLRADTALWVNYMGTIIPSNSDDLLIVRCGRLHHIRSPQFSDAWMSSFDVQ